MSSAKIAVKVPLNIAKSLTNLVNYVVGLACYLPDKQVKLRRKLEKVCVLL
jgi:hypothetical protein